MRIVVVFCLIGILSLGSNFYETTPDQVILDQVINFENRTNIAINAIVKDGVISGGEYDYSHTLGNDFTFHYTVIGTKIHIGLNVVNDAGGWIAIGFGGSSGMNGADLAFGYFSGGNAFMRDDYGTGASSHVDDTIDNIDPGFAGGGNADATRLEFSRDLNTGDTSQDNIIVPGQSIRVYWAQNRDDETFGTGQIRDSGSSNIVIRGPPQPPQSLSAVAGDNSVSLSWTPPSNDGGIALTQYNVYRSTTQGGTYSFVTSRTVTSFTDTGLTNGQTYYYVVTSENSAGESDYSNEASAEPSSVPDAPQSLQATPSEGQVDLSWLAPADDGGRVITNYFVYRSTVQGSLYSQINTTGVLFYSDVGLQNGITYYYVVSANNSNGEGGFSNEASAQPTGVSTPPINIQTSWSDSQVTLTWDAPSNDGGNSITGYKVYRSQQSGTYSLLNDSVTQLNYLDTNVTNGETYYYVITAVNSAGESGYSAEARVTLALTPDPPTGLIIDGTPTQVTLTWTAADGNGNTVTIYTIYRTDTLGGQYSNINTTGSLTYVDTTILNGETYYYAVTANNSIGESGYSNQVSYFVASTPDAPINVVTKSGRDNIRITWSPPGYDGGSLIFSYQIYRSLDNSTFTAINTTSVTLFTDIDLVFGTTYYYKIAAINAIGGGLNSSIVNGSIFTVPDLPSNLTLVSSDALVEIDWIAPSYDGGSVIQGFRIYRSTTSGSPYILIEVVNGTTLEFNDTSVSNGLTYYYVITAYNGAGESEFSVEAFATPSTTPSIPRDLQGFGTNNLVTLAWLPSLSDGGLIIQHYNIYRQWGNNTELVKLNSTNSLTFDDTNVTNGIDYKYKVSAENSRGESAFSNEIIIAPENRDIEVPSETSTTSTTRTTSTSQTNTDIDIDPEKIAEDDVLRDQVIASTAAVSGVMLVFVSTRYIRRKTNQ